MKKTRIAFLILFLFMLLLFAAGCKSKQDNNFTDWESVGTEGLTINFLQNFPQDKYVVSESKEAISVILDIKNRGSFPEQDKQNLLDAGRVYLSGFDDKIIVMKEKWKGLSGLYLPGSSPINPEGGFDTLELEGDIIADNIMVEQYEPTILATICYPYATKAGPSVCVDPYPFDERQGKVCKIGSQTLTSQGAPIAITKIDQEASSNKIQFKISINNVGEGDVTRPGSSVLGKCNPDGNERLGRDDFDRVELVSVKAGSMPLTCGPFSDGSDNLIRLFEGGGFVICTLDMKSGLVSTNSAFTTPLNIELNYNYRSTVSKQVRILKLKGIG